MGKASSTAITRRRSPREQPSSLVSISWTPHSATHAGRFKNAHRCDTTNAREVLGLRRSRDGRCATIRRCTPWCSLWCLPRSPPSSPQYHVCWRVHRVITKRMKRLALVSARLRSATLGGRWTVVPWANQWLRELERARERQDTATERDVLRQRYGRFLSANRAHPQFGRAAPDCEFCQGRGINDGSRNPAEHHDWWQIGGRWDGALGSFSELGSNVARLEDVPADLCPAAVVTAEGDWYEGPANLPSNAEFRAPSDVPEEERVALASWKHW